MNAVKVRSAVTGLVAAMCLIGVGVEASASASTGTGTGTGPPPPRARRDRAPAGRPSWLELTSFRTRAVRSCSSRSRRRR